MAAAIEQYLKPALVGKDPEAIEDIWQTQYVASYFRSGVTLNNALSGVDGALWDILGKRAGMPVYKLLGGKVRTAVPLYTHASATTLEALEELSKDGRLREALIPAAKLLPEIPSEIVDMVTTTQIRNGRDFRTSPFTVRNDARYVKAVTSEGDLVAIGEFKLPRLYHPVLVF